VPATPPRLRPHHTHHQSDSPEKFNHESDALSSVDQHCTASPSPPTKPPHEAPKRCLRTIGALCSGGADANVPAQLEWPCVAASQEREDRLPGLPQPAEARYWPPVLTMATEKRMTLCRTIFPRSAVSNPWLAQAPARRWSPLSTGLAGKMGCQSQMYAWRRCAGHRLEQVDANVVCPRCEANAGDA